MKKPENGTQQNSNNNRANITIESFEVSRVIMFQSGTVAFNLTVNGITIYGCRVVEGKNGDFISFPQQKGRDNKYYNIVFVPISNEDSNKILAEVERQLNGTN